MPGMNGFGRTKVQQSGQISQEPSQTRKLERKDLDGAMVQEIFYNDHCYQSMCRRNTTTRACVEGM